MLESSLGTSVLARCLNEPSKAISVLCNYKPHLIAKDFELLVEHASTHNILLRLLPLLLRPSLGVGFGTLPWTAVSKVLEVYRHY